MQTVAKQKRRLRRGYPVAILVGLDARRAALWSIFSESSKPLATVRLEHVRTDAQAQYRFFEGIVDAVRPAIREGVQSIIIAVPPKTNYSGEFLDHVAAHHAWLARQKGPHAVTFGIVTGIAADVEAVAQLRQGAEFDKILAEATTREGNRVIAMLEKALNDPSGNSYVFYTLEDVEQVILATQPAGALRPEILLVTDEFLERRSQKGRILHLLQIAQNNHVKTRVIAFETAAGARIDQLGGIACLALKQVHSSEKMN